MARRRSESMLILQTALLGGHAQLVFRNAHGVGHLAAVLVDDLHKFLRHGGSAVQHDGEAGQALGYLVQDVKAQRRRHEDALLVAGALCSGELISAVAGADGNGQRVHAGAGDEFLDLFGTGIGGILCGHLDLVLHAGQRAQLALDHNAVIMGVFDNLLGQRNVVLKGLGWSRRS